MLFNVYLEEALKSNQSIWKYFKQDRGLAYADDLMMKTASLKEIEIIIKDFLEIELKWGIRLNRRKCEILSRRGKREN